MGEKNSEHSDKVKGSVKEAIGKLIGDGKVDSEGKSQQKLPKSDTKPSDTSTT